MSLLMYINLLVIRLIIQSIGCIKYIKKPIQSLYSILSNTEKDFWVTKDVDFLSLLEKFTDKSVKL